MTISSNGLPEHKSTKTTFAARVKMCMAVNVQMRQPYGHKMWFVVPYLNFAGANETETINEVQENFFF